jgi:predicted phage baseplate assembly protein
VIFGDGVHGARLPTGQENVVAHYRTGIGPVGDAPAGALSLLQQRPLGISEVTNPVPAAGGVDRESVEEARTNAPLTVLTLDRVVSVRDHADFARAFVGVAKARAVVLWNGTAPFVHVTVAAPDGRPMGDLTLGHLRDAFELLRHRGRAVQIDDFEALRFVVEVQVLVEETLLFAAVQEVVRSTLVGHFALARRDFAQPVTAAEVLATVQNVPGVRAARMAGLHLSDGSGLTEVLTAADAVRVSAPLGGSDVHPAQILLLADDGVRVTEMTS